VQSQRFSGGRFASRSAAIHPSIDGDESAYRPLSAFRTREIAYILKHDAPFAVCSSLAAKGVLFEQNQWKLLLLLLFLAHQHKTCRQLKIKQEMTAVGD